MELDQNITLVEAATAFLATLPLEERNNHNQEVNRFLRWFGSNHKATALTPPELGNYADQVAKSGGNYKQKLGAVRAFLLFLNKQKITSSNLSLHLKTSELSSKAPKIKTRAAPKEVKVVTREGYTALEQQLAHQKKELEAATDEVVKARADKDFRENAPLEAARESQAQAQSKIIQLESALKSAVLVNEHRVVGAKAEIGNTVHLRNMTTGDLLKYKLVDPVESDLTKGKISITSPLGKSLLGRSNSEVVEVKAPMGTFRYSIESIAP